MNIKKFILEDGCNKNFSYLVILQKEEEYEEIKNCIITSMENLEYAGEDIIQDLKEKFKTKDVIALHDILHFEY